MRTILNLLWILTRKQYVRYHYQLKKGQAVEQCPITDAGVGSLYCGHVCPYRYRNDQRHQWVECRKLSRWLLKNKRMCVDVRNDGNMKSKI